MCLQCHDVLRERAYDSSAEEQGRRGINHDGLGITVDAGEVKEPDTYTHGGVTQAYRYNAVSE